MAFEQAQRAFGYVLAIVCPRKRASEILLAQIENRNQIGVAANPARLNGNRHEDRLVGTTAITGKTE
jgi:hypothetical protein